MNNFRRRSSSKKARVLVNSYRETRYSTIEELTVNSAMPFTIGKTVGSTASLSIDVTFVKETRTIYEYSDGSKLYGTWFNDPWETVRFRDATIVSEDFMGEYLCIRAENNTNMYIIETGDILDFYATPLPGEGQTVTTNAYIGQRGSYSLNEHVTITIVDTGDNYLVTITSLL